MRLLMTIHATIGNSPIKVKGVINVRSHNDPKITRIYDRFFNDNSSFNKAIVDRNSRAMYMIESEFDYNDYQGNVIKYSKVKGITGKLKIIVPSLQYNSKG